VNTQLLRAETMANETTGQKRGYLSGGRRPHRWTRATARTPGIGLWVLVMMAQLRAAMEVQS
jgi:hypothetical protein